MPPRPVWGQRIRRPDRAASRHGRDPGRQRAPAGNPLLVKTPTVAIGVRGTSYRVHHDLLATTREVPGGPCPGRPADLQRGRHALLVGDQGTRHQTGERQLQCALPAPEPVGLAAQIRQARPPSPCRAVQRHRILVAPRPCHAGHRAGLGDVDGGPAALSLETLGLGTWHVRVQALDDWGLASQGRGAARPGAATRGCASDAAAGRPRASVVRSSEAGVELV